MNTRTCGEVRADLSAYLEGDLDAAQAEANRLHLESCAACRSELALQRLATDALRRLPVLPPPAAILAGVRSRLRPEPWYARLFCARHWRLELPLGAAATLLVALGISLLPARHPELPTTVQRDFPAPPAPATGGAVSDRLAVPAAPARPSSRGARRATEAPAPARQDVPGGREAAAPAKAAPLRTVVREPARSFERANALVARPGSGTAGVAATRDLEAAPWRVPSDVLAARVVGLLPPGGAVDDLTTLLRAEGAGDVRISALPARGVREVAAAHRGRPDLPAEPVRGWVVSATVPPRARDRVLDALTSRTGLRYLERRAPPEAPEEPAGVSELRFTVLQ